MLVLSRRKGQRIRIGDDIEVTVVAVHRSSTKLAISAPPHLTVLRSEVVDDESAPEPEWAVDNGCLVALKAGARLELLEIAQALVGKRRAPTR